MQARTLFTGTQKYLAERKLDSVGFIKAHSGIANAPERVKRIKSELQLAYHLLKFLVQIKMSKFTNKAAASTTLRNWPGGCREASEATRGFFEAHDAGDPRTFSLQL
jgi:hypothetical protein